MKRFILALLLVAGAAQAQTAPAAQLAAARAADKAQHWAEAEPLYAAYLKAVPTDTAAAKDYTYVLLQCLEHQPQPQPVDYYAPAVASCTQLIAAGQPRYLYFRAVATTLRARAVHDATYTPLLSSAGRDLVAYEQQHGADSDSQQLRGMLGRMGWKPSK